MYLSKICILFHLCLLTFAGEAMAQLPSLPKYTVTSLVDSIEVQHGVKIKLPQGYHLDVLEDWINFSASKPSDGSSSINLFNGIVKGKDIIAIIRPLGPDYFPRHSYKNDAFLASGYDYVNGHQYPEDFKAEDYIQLVPEETAQLLFGADWIKYLPIEASAMSFQEYDLRDDIPEPELQKLMMTDYPNVRLYYFEKEGYPRFDVVVLWKDMGKRTEKRLLKRLSKIIHY